VDNRWTTLVRLGGGGWIRPLTHQPRCA
jgi:hypothetical protein